MLLLSPLPPPHTNYTWGKKACPQYINSATQFSREGLIVTVSRQLRFLCGQDPEFPCAPTEGCRSWLNLSLLEGVTSVRSQASLGATAPAGMRWCPARSREGRRVHAPQVSTADSHRIPQSRPSAATTPGAVLASRGCKDLQDPVWVQVRPWLSGGQNESLSTPCRGRGL